MVELFYSGLCRRSGAVSFERSTVGRVTLLLGFKRQFAKFVEEGSKQHTIRGIRKVAPKVGEICHCYADPRQKTMRLLGRFVCTRIERIDIYFGRQRELKGYAQSGIKFIEIEGVALTDDEMNLLAFADGFRPVGDSPIHQMSLFWAREHGCLDGFKGHIIHWRHPNPVHVEPAAPLAPFDARVRPNHGESR